MIELIILLIITSFIFSAGFRVVGHKTAQHYLKIDKNIDFYTLDNEDNALTAEIAASGAFNFPLPYPAGIDLTQVTPVIQYIDFGYQDEVVQDADSLIAIPALEFLFSLLNAQPDTTGSSDPLVILNDTNTVEFKKYFDGPYLLNCVKSISENGATPDGGISILSGESFQGDGFIRWVPVLPIDTLMPLFITILNRTRLVAATDFSTAIAAAAFTTTHIERFWIRPHFTIRTLSKSEKSDRSGTGSNRWRVLNA